MIKIMQLLKNIAFVLDQKSLIRALAEMNLKI